MTRLTCLILCLLFARSWASGEAAGATQIPVAGDWMTLGFNSLWEHSGNNLKRVDPNTNEVIADIKVGKQPSRGIVASDGEIWIASCGGDELVRVDPKTNAVTKKIPLELQGSEGSFAVDDKNVWIATGADSDVLKAIDRKTGNVASETKLPASVAGVISAYGSIWATDPKNNKLYQIDPSTGKVVKTIKTRVSPRFLTSGGGAIWVLNQGDGSVQKFDPRGELITNIETGLAGKGGDITWGDGAIWVTSKQVPATRINPNTNRVDWDYRAEGMGDAIRVGYGSIWVSGRQLNRISLKDSKLPSLDAKAPDQTMGRK